MDQAHGMSRHWEGIKWCHEHSSMHSLHQLANAAWSSGVRTTHNIWNSHQHNSFGRARPLQELRIDYLDPTLLLPVCVEHTIDERSPLHGHTQQSLAVGDAWPTTSASEILVQGSFLENDQKRSLHLALGCCILAAKMCEQLKLDERLQALDLRTAFTYRVWNK
eukprot:scaffold21684_cov18-Tisochrysis_lutea.AAC.2